MRTFATVDLPVVWRPLLAAAGFAFAVSLGEFGATITFVSSIPGETRTLSSAIYGLLQVPGAESRVWLLCAVSVAISFVAMLAAEALLQRGRTDPPT